MAKRSMDAVGPSERQMHAHEAYASAMLLSMLYFLWGAVALPLVPPVFRRLDVAHLVAGSCGLVYFWSTRRRPRAWIAYAFSAAVIVHTLAVLPWTAIVWCRMARPFEATTVPQMAIVCMALMVPRSLVLGLVVMTLFAGEGAFVTLWAHHVGQAALVPIGEPVLTLYITIPAVALLWLRDRRRKLACRYIALHGEIAALGRLEPLFRRVRDELAAQLRLLDGEIAALGPTAPPPSMGRAVGRLVDVSDALGTLVEGRVAVGGGLERGLLAADAQSGVTMLAAVLFVVAAAWGPIAGMQISALQGLGLGMIGVVAGGVLLVLIRTWQRPSERRARIALLLLVGVTLPIMSINQTAFLHTTRPFVPFGGHKLLMVTLGVAAASWASVGLPLIVVTLVDALALYFWLGFDALKGRMSIAEPWLTLVFAAVGAVALAMRDQRRIASLAVLREEAAASALHQRALLLLSLRDQLNTPLQTLVAGVTRLELVEPTRDIARLHAGIRTLVALSRELAQVDVPSESQVATLAGYAPVPS